MGGAEHVRGLAALFDLAGVDTYLRIYPTLNTASTT